MMDGRTRRAKVVHVQLDAPLEPIAIEPGYPEAVLIAHLGPAVIGHVSVRATPVLSPDEQWTALAGALGRDIWRHRVLEAFLRAARSPYPEPDVPAMKVSVIVCTRDRPQQLKACLQSVLSLRTSPEEIIVVDNAPTDARTREVCEGLPVHYVQEPLPGQTRARNRGIAVSSGEAIAFTDDDCVADRGWLDRLDKAFTDPLVMAVTGYIGPLELEAPAQYLFEYHGGFERHARARVFDPLKVTPVRAAAVAGAGANMIFRRRVFDEIGPFAEDLGPGTPARSSDDKYAFYRLLAAGYRIAYDPARIVWHRHRADHAGLLQIMNDYGVSEFALSTRLLLRHREPAALSIMRWWLRHFAHDLRKGLRRDPAANLPLELPWAEIRGALCGPLSLVRSARSRRGVQPVQLPAEAKSQAAKPDARVTRETPALSVALASYNRRERLREVLLALAHQDHSIDAFEVVLVLDGSTDGSAEMARSLPVPYRLRVLEQDNRGLAVTRNRGARESCHPIVVFLDDDIVPVPGFLSAHARAHSGAVDDRLVLGYYPPAGTPRSIWAISLRAWWEDHFRRKAEHDHQWTYIDMADGNSSLPFTLLERFGGYDERFTGGRRQDWELGIRLLSGGVRFSYHPEAKGLHHFDDHFTTAVRNIRQEGRYDVLLAQTHPHVRAQLPLARVVFFSPAGPREAVRRSVVALIDPTARRTVPLLLALEGLGLRRRWLQAASHVLLRSYALGVLDAVGGTEEVRALLADTSRCTPSTVPVSLDDSRGITVPPGAGAVDVAVRFAGRPVGRTRAMEPGGQWDWEALAQQVAEELCGPAAIALSFELLEQARSGNPAASWRE